MRTLLIDDVRNIHCDVVARNAEVAKAVLANIEFDKVYLDHDLGPGEDGLDILRWMLRLRIRPKRIYSISMNPDGRRRINEELRANGYKMSDPGSTAWIDSR